MCAKRSHFDDIKTVIKLIMGIIITYFYLSGTTILAHNLDNLDKKRKEIMKNFYINKKVLVTGGAGFIGSHLCELLIELGANITIIDDLSTGSLNNINKFKDQITFIQKSILDYDACLQATRDQEVIFHLAAFVSVPASVADPVNCHAINVDGILYMLEAARTNHVKRFVFSSSSAIYGPTKGVCYEDQTPQPFSPYGFSKLIGEYYCRQYHLNYQVQTACLRYFNVFGERQDPNSQYAAVVAKFRDQMAKNLPITIFGDGLQTRDFVSVKQVAYANCLVGMQDAPMMDGKAFNIATGKSINLLELVDILKEQEFPNYTQEIIFAPARPGDVLNTAADCSRYQKLLDSLYGPLATSQATKNQGFIAGDFK